MNQLIRCDKNIINRFSSHRSIVLRNLATESKKKDIRIYKGEGVSPLGYKMTKFSVEKFCNLEKYNVKSITPEQVISEDWEPTTKLIVMPGGRDMPYVEALGNNTGRKTGGNKRIRKFVEEGGSYFGICAGAYYGADQVQFDTGGNLQVQGERELKFFPGIADGPAYEGFSYTDESYARSVWILYPFFYPTLVETILTSSCWFFGGPHFKPYKKDDDRFKVLAYYFPHTHKNFTEDDAIAAVSCNVGKGKAVLCGPHPEYDPEMMPKHANATMMMDMTNPYFNTCRKIFFNNLLKECGIHVDEYDILPPDPKPADGDDDEDFCYHL